MTRAARNTAGFVAGWLFILAIALGMEAAHAIEFKSVGNGSPWSFQYVGPSGSDLCEQLRTSRQQTANPNQTVTVKPPPITLTRTEVSGACVISVAEPCYTDYQGVQHCPTATTTPATTYYSRCTATDPWVLINASAPACATPQPTQCPTTSETDAPAATGVMVNDSAATTMCQAECQISPFSTDDGSSITTTPVGGQTATIRGSASTRWKVVGVCQTDPDGALQAELNAEKCQTVNGETVCVGGSTPKNCIKVSGGLSCTSDAGGVCTTPECVAMANAVKNADGSATAKQGEPTPSAPNTGTAGQRATPQISYSQTRADGLGGSGTTAGYDWFSPTTVAGSYNGDGSVGDRATQTGDDEEEPECDPATETCEGEEEEPGECSEPGSCSGESPELGEVREFGESLSALLSAFHGSPFAQSLQSFEIPDGGSCPTFTVPFQYGAFSTSPVISYHCELGSQLRPQLRAMFIVFWVLVALFLFMRP